MRRDEKEEQEKEEGLDFAPPPLQKFLQAPMYTVLSNSNTPLLRGL